MTNEITLMYFTNRQKMVNILYFATSPLFNVNKAAHGQRYIMEKLK